jgi:hypothetical protein
MRDYHAGLLATLLCNGQCRTTLTVRSLLLSEIANNSMIPFCQYHIWHLVVHFIEHSDCHLDHTLSNWPWLITVQLTSMTFLTQLTSLTYLTSHCLLIPTMISFPSRRLARMWLFPLVSARHWIGTCSDKLRKIFKLKKGNWLHQIVTLGKTLHRQLWIETLAYLLKIYQKFRPPIIRSRVSARRVKLHTPKKFLGKDTYPNFEINLCWKCQFPWLVDLWWYLKIIRSIFERFEVQKTLYPFKKN